ncbi:hypothetical protein [Sphaerisporangium aureirubrum]|uniref:Uncharacterized protein n=1 Tax=Sphaerisporangium aureirubrum TaxID=1544736 RepID=A0ABW1N9Q3_9ACTN
MITASGGGPALSCPKGTRRHRAPNGPVSTTRKGDQSQAAGTEMLADTIRHNPSRTTELFRRFLTPGRFYERLDGAWGYGDRIPFDQHSLVATLAPRAIVLHNTVNDYGDGAESDPLGLQAAKFVYRTLGYDADDLVKFNVRPVPPGQPHAEDTPQRKMTAEYLDHYFYDKEMSPQTASYLNDDPFDGEGARAENAYNRYFGGYRTIAPWKDYELRPSHCHGEQDSGRNKGCGPH